MLFIGVVFREGHYAGDTAVPPIGDAGRASGTCRCGRPLGLGGLLPPPSPPVGPIVLGSEGDVVSKSSAICNCLVSGSSQDAVGYTHFYVRSTRSEAMIEHKFSEK
ncbi:hypothetical protein GWI33_010298 [Rhynchophorus ferrugineus]|uniref:Uncharacterized protein n=1 Tax=Rhynchophorus ferrugineus TaxID=354439 RepID=A0A834MKF9_RHYFE|nr:hypothetical protein GWI33_010298 [Rhynchophorus ferrugineus]